MVFSENLAIGSWQLAVGNVNDHGNDNGKTQNRTSARTARNAP